MTEARPRFPVGLTVATAAALALLIGLGAWQLHRLQWKQAILARVEALRTARPQPAGAVLDRLGRGEAVDYARVTLDCPGLGAAPYLELYALREGRAGSRLISACPAGSASYRSVLVDRGFVADAISARPPVDPADRTPMTVTGVLRVPDRPTFVTPANRPDENHWWSRDAAAMARALGASSPAPLFLMAETSSNPRWKALTPAPLPEEIPNRHLEYALTWFGLAGALLGVYAALLWRRRRA